MIIFLSLFLISLFAIVRIGLIITGMLKGPVLEAYEVYGEEEPFYYPWAWLVFWIAWIVIWGGVIVNRDLGKNTITNYIGLFLLFISWLIYLSKEYVRKNFTFLPPIPFWYAKLCENTTRYERRRIAYMWLRLPLRTRLLYSASDHFFFLWVDLVVMASVRES
jgi:hypothetical protein